MMRLFVVNVFLALGWAAATGAFSLANLALGFALGACALMLVPEGGSTTSRFARLRGMLVLLALFVGNLVASGIHCAALALRPRATLRPGLLACPLRVDGDVEINLLTMLVAFAPGTLFVELSRDRRTLLVHAFDAADADRVRAMISDRLEARILEALR